MGNSNEEYDTGLRHKGKKVSGVRSKDMEAEVRHNFDTKPGDQLTCANCGDKYERGAWDFHRLCDVCFKAYDIQKMRGRINFYKGKGTKKDYFESSTEWIESMQTQNA